MTGVDTPEVRARLLEPQSIVWPAGPYSVEIAGRELTIGDVYAVHPQATAINGKEAIAALDAGQAEGFQVHSTRRGSLLLPHPRKRATQEIPRRYCAVDLVWSRPARRHR